MSRGQGAGHTLRDFLPLMSPAPWLPFHSTKCSHHTSIATVRFPGQELQDSHLQAPVWSETVTSADQRYKTAGTLPQIPALPYSQYPVLWFEHCGIEEWIGVSELVKFTDDKPNRKTPPDQHLPSFLHPPHSAREYMSIVGSVLRTSV